MHNPLRWFTFQHLLTRDSDWGNPTDSRHHTPHNAAANGEIRETMQVASPAVQQRGAGPQIANDTASENNTRFVVLPFGELLPGPHKTLRNIKRHRPPSVNKLHLPTCRIQ